MQKLLVVATISRPDGTQLPSVVGKSDENTIAPEVLFVVKAFVEHGAGCLHLVVMKD